MSLLTSLAALAIGFSASGEDPVRWDGGFNPFLPLHEYIPDAEPRVFGNRLYVYGSHDRAGSRKFCDTILKVWSAPLNDLTKWSDHGVIFSTKAEKGVKDDVSWSDIDLYAPDVIENNGRYYLFAYIVGAPMAVAVSDKPWGPFKKASQIKAPLGAPKGFGGWSQYIDPGVLVDDDGKVHLYWGFQKSFYAQLDPRSMTEVLPGTYRENIIPIEAPFNFFEACSPRKIKGRYYLVYADGGILVYAVADRPEGPFRYGGPIIRNGRDYPGGNIHGGLVQLHGEWFITYHRMTNGTIFSRRTCVERVKILSDGSIPEVEMTSMGFSRGLNPLQETPADVACVLTGRGKVTEFDPRTRAVVGTRSGSALGYKYFEFGPKSQDLEFQVVLRPLGAAGELEIWIDGLDSKGQKIGSVALSSPASSDWQTLKTKLTVPMGRHAIYLRFTSPSNDQELAHVKSFVFREVL